MEKKWLALIRRLKIKINSAWFLSRTLPFSLSMSFLYLAMVFHLKKYHNAFFIDNADTVNTIACAIFIICHMLLYFIARKNFYSTADVIEKVDEKLQLNCRLIWAFEQKGEHPPLPQNTETGIQFRRHHLLSLVLLPLIVIAALIIPIHPLEANPPTNQPSSWKQIEEKLEELKNTPDLDQKEVENVRKQLKELQNQDRKKWFDHSSLEAGESLKNDIKQQQREFRKQVRETARAMERMKAASEIWNKLKKSEKISPEQQKKVKQKWDEFREQWNQEYKKMLRQKLQVNQELLDQIKALGDMPLDKKGFEKLEAEHERLLKRLKKLGEGEKEDCPDCAGSGCQQCNGTGKKSDKGKGPGKGAINRGPGEGGDPLGDEESDRLNDKIEKLLGQSKPDSMPGQLIKMQTGEHDIDQSSYQGPTQSQDSQNKGLGGEAVWRNDLLPEEQEFLKRYYK